MKADIVSQLYEDCRKVKGRVFIYGCGNYAEIGYKVLKKARREVAGFIVSAVHEKDAYFHGVPVYEYGKISDILSENDCIIVAYSGEVGEKEEFFRGCVAKTILCSDTDFMKMMYWNYNEAELFPPVGIIEPARDIKRNVFERILVALVEKTFGDLIWASAFLRELRRCFPTSEIAVVINPEMMSLMRCCPYVDKILCYGAEIIGEVLSKRLTARMKDYAKKELQGYDAVFVARELPVNRADLWENYLIAVYSGASVIIGHALCTNEAEQFSAEQFQPYMSKLVLHYDGDHQVNRRLDLLRSLNLEVQSRKMEVWFGLADKDAAEYMLRHIRKNGRKLIVVALNGSTGERAYKPQYFRVVFEELCKAYDVGFLLMGGSDASENAKLFQDLGEICLDLTGKTTLAEAAAVISFCDIYLGVDTGLMHMAAALGKPIIEISHSLPDALPTDPFSIERTGPWETEFVALKPSKALEPCKRFCRMKFPHCINQIRPEKVIEAVERFFLEEDVE